MGGRRPRRKKGGGDGEVEVVEDPPTPKTPDEEKGDSESDSDIPMYFTEPQQLLDIFANLEETNLFLIENCQETEEAIEDLNQKFEAEKAKTHKETAELTRQMEELKAQIDAEKEKALQLEARSSNKKVDDKKEKEKAKARGRGGKEEPEEEEDKSKKQAEYEQALNQKVTEVYEKCIGQNESNIDAIPMLAQIEKNLEKLLDVISEMEPEFVAREEGKRYKDRREEARAKQMEEKEREQMIKMAERQKRAAQPVQKKTGKTLMTRHMHERRKKRDDKEETNDEEEDIKEFFM